MKNFQKFKNKQKSSFLKNYMSESKIIYTIWKEIKIYIWYRQPRFCLKKQFYVKIKNKKMHFFQKKKKSIF